MGSRLDDNNLIAELKDEDNNVNTQLEIIRLLKKVNNKLDQLIAK